MDALNIMREIISILVGGITGVAEGIGEGLQALVTNLMFTGTGEEQTLSAFAVVTIIFAGIALAIGLCRLIVRFISTLGGSAV